MSDRVMICSHNEGLQELRVHGAGDTPLEELLGKGEYRLVRGDTDTAGFYRREDVPYVEAYSWGKFTHRQRSRAFWVLLAPFTLANVAGWLVSEGPRARVTRCTRALVRLMGLGITLMFVLWLGVVAVDTVALQCGGQPLCADRQVWLRFFNSAVFVDHPERRLVVGILVPVVIVLLLVVLAGWRSADAYERYQNSDVAYSDTERGKGDHPLRDGSLWRTFHAVRGSALLHSSASLAGIAACGAFGIWRIAQGDEDASLLRFFSQWSFDHVLVYASLGVLIGASYRVARNKVPRDEPTKAGGEWGWAWGLVGGAVALLGGVALRGLLGGGDSPVHSGAGSWGFGHAAFALGSLVVALLIPLGILLLWSRRKDAAYRGFGSFVTMALAVIVASAFAAGTIQWATDWLGDPSDTAILASELAEASTRLDAAIDGTLPGCEGVCSEPVIRRAAGDYVIALDGVQQAPLSVPTGFDIYAVLIFVLLGLMALYAAGLEGWLRRKKVPYASCPSEQTHSALIERAHQRSTREERRWRKDIARDTRSSPRNTRIHRIAGWVLVPAGILAVVFLGSYWANVGSVVPWFAEWLEGSGAWALKSSRWAIAAAIVAAGVYVQRSYRDPTKRRALGGVWDIATFWPRSYHPFAPPTYSARAVPELRARIKELLDDGVTMLVVSSHSQGVPITMAAIAQLEADERNRIAFLSHGSPTGALYGAFFPDYYGPQRMKQFGDLLVDADVGAGKVRWRSIWRITDWTGGYAFPPPRLDLDANVDCTGTGRYERWMTGPPRAGEDERRAMSEVASMASEVEVLWCDPHRDAEISAGDPLPPSVGHHTYLTDDGYPEVCDTLRGLLSARPAVEGRESMSDGEKGKRTTVSVKAGKRLTDSGVVVEPGMRYRISARPTDRWIDWFIPSGPDGYTKWFLKPVEFLRRAPRAPWFALMATVGGGEPFLVGTGLEFNADAGGRLELFANDIAFMYWNNWGQIHVTIDLVGPAL